MKNNDFFVPLGILTFSTLCVVAGCGGSNVKVKPGNPNQSASSSSSSSSSSGEVIGASSSSGGIPSSSSSSSGMAGSSNSSSSSSSSSSSNSSSSSSSSSTSSSGGANPEALPLPGRWQAQSYSNASPETDGRSGAQEGPCSLGDVDLDVTTDQDGGCFVGWTTPGEWIEFEVAGNSQATYDLVLRLASNEAGKQVTVAVDGVDVGTASSPGNGWTSYQNILIEDVVFTTGEHTVRITFDDGGVNLNYVESVTPGAVADPLEGYHPDITRIADIKPSAILRAPGNNWGDSYSVGDRCYCDTTFDHNIGGIEVETSIGIMTVRQACNMIGKGPGSNGRPVYNDIQCGNGPANDAGDEDWCPGRVDKGKAGCVEIGPKWKFD